MDEMEYLDYLPDIEPTPEELEAWEEERKARLEEELVPYRKAAQQRRETAETAAEHDTLLMELLFKDTLRELEV